MIVPPRLRWRRSALTRLDGRGLAALDTLATLVKEKPATRPDIEGVVWGQFLDIDRYSERHWGRYGTSAAVQVLHAAHVRGGHEGRVVERDPLNRLADVFPTDVDLTAVEKEWPSSYKPNDVRRVLKLSAWVEALEPDTPQIRSPLPGIVEHLLTQAVDEEGWSTRPPGAEERRKRDRLLATAYALFALRRYPDALNDRRIGKAHEWVARQLGEEAIKRHSPDLVALCALCFITAPEGKRKLEVVRAARKRADRQLQSAALGWPHPRIDRPHFHGFNEGDTNDYIFLSPELLMALYFLCGRNPPATRTFVLRVVRGIADNILDERAAGQAGDLKGFRIQSSSMMGTVDQMWAARVLLQYHLRYQQDWRSLRPPKLPRSRLKPSRAAVGTGGVICLVGGSVLAALGTPVLGIPVAVLGAGGTLVSTIGRWLLGKATQRSGGG